MRTTMEQALRGTPTRFYALAAAGAVATAVVGSQVDWDPWRYETSVLADGWGRLAATGCLVLWVVVPLLALLWPRRSALLALVPFAVFTLVAGDRHEWSFALFLSLVAAAMVASWRDPRSALLMGAAALLPVASYLVGVTTILLPYRTQIATWSGLELWDRAVTLLLYVAVVAICLGLARWMRRSALDARHAAQLEARSAEVERESALVGERAILARDLHDVVAHHVSLIAVRAETAPYTVPDLPPGARTLLADIATDSRRALDELRGVLGVLRRSSEPAELSPQPGANDIADLVRQARSAGAQVEWEAVDLGDVAPTAGYVAYRVAQEALTNVRRHAAGATVRLSTVSHEGGLTLRIANDAPGPVVEGRGLTGMRERVEALGGTLTLSTDAGTLEIVAEIPGGPA